MRTTARRANMKTESQLATQPMKTSTIPSRTLIGAGCTLVLSLAFALKASAATIDFENLPGMPNAIVPVPVASQLSDQFLSTLGVRFSSGSPYVAVVNLGGYATSGINAVGG